MNTYFLNYLLKTLRIKPTCSSQVQVSNYSSCVKAVIFKPKDAHLQDNLKTGRKYTINKLEDLLGVHRRTAMNLVMDNKVLSQAPGILLEKNYDLCKEHGIDKETCIKHPAILAEVDLKTKLEMLNNVPQDINVTAPLITMKLQDLHKICKDDLGTSNLQYRLVTFERLLKVTPEQIIEAFVKRPFLRIINLKRFENVIQLLLDNGITAQDIIKDWWVLRYSIKTIQQRFDLARSKNVEVVKTWMVRSNTDILANYVKRRSDNRSILGDATLSEYLAERLDCSETEVKRIISRHPALENKGMKKLEQIINFLYAEGFKPYHIRRVPKILCHSVDTTLKRIRELEKQGMYIDSLSVLTKSQKQYMQYYEGLVKSNKNKIKANAA